MNIPWWVYRIWQARNGGVNYGRPLNTYKRKQGREGEAEKLNELIEATLEQLPDGATRRDAERIVAYAWALYVYADPPVYDDITKFPLSSFIEVAQGYILAAHDGIHKLEPHWRNGEGEKAFLEHGPVARDT